MPGEAVRVKASRCSKGKPNSEAQCPALPVAKGFADVIRVAVARRLRRSLRLGSATPRGIKHDKTPRTFSAGCGRQARFAENQVEHSPFARGHGWEGMRSSRRPHALDRDRCRFPQSPLAVCFEMVRIERHLIVQLRFEPQDLGCDMLEGLQPSSEERLW